MIDVLVSGGGGKMGREVIAAVTAAPGMRVVAAVDTAHAEEPISDGAGGSITCEADLSSAIDHHRPHVMVDFTHPEAVEAHVRTAASAGIDCVVGTTGLAVGTLETIAASAPEGTCVFFAPNFAIGAVLMMRFAAEAARYMPHVEIIELHHDRKADAPSGTALRTAALIAETRPEAPAIPGRESQTFEGARGALVEEIAIHSVRLPGLVAHQEVLFGGQGQTLSIRHDSIDRTSFMPGVVLAIRAVRERTGFVIGLENLMEM
ncbi:MAG: 4-hydroxy-tetrahydrodipicolinate reductase [Clostridiales bacterium]|nr:4-hydroxy-tetrahydrodipicolinate reductase [Clostridiales bacterium]